MQALATGRRPILALVGVAALAASFAAPATTRATDVPSVTIEVAPNAPWPSSMASFVFSAPGDVTFECSLNGAAFAPCSSPATVTTSVTFSANTFGIRARAADGTAGPTTTATWTPVDDVWVGEIVERLPGSAEPGSRIRGTVTIWNSSDADVTGVSIQLGDGSVGVSDLVVDSFDATIPPFVAGGPSPVRNVGFSVLVTGDPGSSGNFVALDLSSATPDVQLTTPASTRFSVNDVNHAPVAAADTYSLAKNKPISVAASAGVLANDSDADGDALAAQLIAPPAAGTLDLRPDGSFTWTPPKKGSVKSVSFTYRASDGRSTSSPATVTLAVGKGR